MGNHADWIGLDWARRNPIGLEPDWIGAVPINHDWIGAVPINRPIRFQSDWRLDWRQSNRDWRQSNRDWHNSNDSDRDFPMTANFRREHKTYFHLIPFVN